MTGYRANDIRIFTDPNSSIRIVTDPDSPYRGLITGYVLGNSCHTDIVPYSMKKRSDGRIEMKIIDLKGKKSE